MQSVLFTPFDLGGTRLSNRIVVAPMCQYSAQDGEMNEWHVMHPGNLAVSGAALLTIEATAVVPEGRISYGDVGLWDDRTESALARVVDGVRRWSDIPIAIQLSHAGRKASHERYPGVADGRFRHHRSMAGKLSGRALSRSTRQSMHQARSTAAGCNAFQWFRFPYAILPKLGFSVRQFCCHAISSFSFKPFLSCLTRLWRPR